MNEVTKAQRENEQEEKPQDRPRPRSVVDPLLTQHVMTRAGRGRASVVCVPPASPQSREARAPSHVTLSTVTLA